MGLVVLMLAALASPFVPSPGAAAEAPVAGFPLDAAAPMEGMAGLGADLRAPPEEGSDAIRRPPRAAPGEPSPAGGPRPGVDDPGPPYGFPNENTLGWTTKAPGQFDQWVWDTTGTITFDIDIGKLNAKKDIPAEKDYILELYFGIVGWFWYDGDGVFDPVPNQNSNGVGDDPCPKEPMKLFTVHVNDRKIRTVEGENTRPCTPGGGEVSRTFDIVRIGDDRANWVRVPKDAIVEGKNTVKLEIHDFPVGPPDTPSSPYHSESSDGWEVYVDAVALELAAPPLVLSHGWTPDWDPPWVDFGSHWLPHLKGRILNEMLAHLGQDPWRWAWDTQLGGGIWMNRYDRKQDFRISAAQLQTTVIGFHSLVGYEGSEGWMQGHSMGGLVSRWYLEIRGGHEKIARFAQTASPNTGSFAADGYTLLHWLDYYAYDGDLTARNVRIPPFIGPRNFLGWRNWWDPNIGAQGINGSGVLRDNRADFELKPESRNPILQELNGAFPAPGVEYFTVRGDYGLWRGVFRWAVPGDGVVTLASATLDGRIRNFRTVDASHEDVPNTTQAARWLMRYYTDLDLDTGKPKAQGAGAAAEAPPALAEAPFSPQDAAGRFAFIKPEDLVEGPFEAPVVLDGAPHAEVGLLVGLHEGPLELSLRDPDGKVYTEEDAALLPWLDFHEDRTFALRSASFGIASPKAGTWTLLVKPNDLPPLEGLPVYLTALLDSTVRLEAGASAARVLPEREVALTATLTDGGAPLLGATVRAHPAEGGDALAMRDDGASGDGAAGDGVYGAVLTAPAQERALGYRVEATGTGSGGAFARSANVEVVVAALADIAVAAAGLEGTPAGAWGGEPVTLAATVTSGGEREVRGTIGASFYDGDPGAGGRLLGRTTLKGPVPVGESRVLRLAAVAPAHPMALHVIVDTDDVETDARNNAAGAPMPFVPTPRTAATVSGPAGRGGWFTGPVQVALGPYDGSPPPYVATSLRLDGGAETPYAGPFAVAAEGDHLLEFWSTDAQGRVEPVRAERVRIDMAAPTAALRHPAPRQANALAVAAPNPAGFTAVAGIVDVTVAASDAVSGVARVALAVDGVAVGEAALGSDGAWHFAWDTTKTSLGNHVLQWRAEDAAGHAVAGAQPVYVLASRTVEVDKDPALTRARLTPGGA